MLLKTGVYYETNKGGSFMRQIIPSDKKEVVC